MSETKSGSWADRLQNEFNYRRVVFIIPLYAGLVVLGMGLGVNEYAQTVAPLVCDPIMGRLSGRCLEWIAVTNNWIRVSTAGGFGLVLVGSAPGWSGRVEAWVDAGDPE